MKKKNLSLSCKKYFQFYHKNKAKVIIVMRRNKPQICIEQKTLLKKKKHEINQIYKKTQQN